MNKRNILKVANAIETAAKKKEGLRGVGFNMAMWVSSGLSDHVDACGTVACIAGWSYLLAHPSATADEMIGIDAFSPVIPDDAAAYLGLGNARADQLFRPALKIGWSEITPAHAVAVLRHLAKTGKVDWSIQP